MHNVVALSCVLLCLVVLSCPKLFSRVPVFVFFNDVGIVIVGWKFPIAV